MMQKINKNTESNHVLTEHLVLRLYLSMRDFDECDIRVPKKDGMEKNTYTLILSLSPLLFLYTAAPIHTPLPLLLEKGKSWLIHLHYNTNAISPAFTFLICLSYIYFISPSFSNDVLQATNAEFVPEISGLGVRRMKREMVRLCVHGCVWSCLLLSGG